MIVVVSLKIEIINLLLLFFVLSPVTLIMLPVIQSESAFSVGTSCIMLSNIFITSQIGV